MKTTHKPRQELKPVKNTKSYRYAEIRHKTVTFLFFIQKKNTMTIQDKQFTVKYDVRSLVHGVPLKSLCKKLYIPT